METYKSIIAYDGTDFQGYQRQADDLRTVQGELERGLRRLGWKEESLKAAGRTDAGVHARGQVISYTLDWNSEPGDLTRALNANVPYDIAVWNTEIERSDFHPRYSAQRRLYKYEVFCSAYRDPLKERYSWRIWPIPSFEVMAECAQQLVCQRDYAAFGHAPTEGGHTVREIFRAEWIRKSEMLIFEFEGNAFLYHMVRRLVAAMISIGHKPAGREKFEELLQNPSLRWEGAIAPPNGLSLEKVVY